MTLAFVVESLTRHEYSQTFWRVVAKSVLDMNMSCAPIAQEMKLISARHENLIYQIMRRLSHCMTQHNIQPNETDVIRPVLHEFDARQTARTNFSNADCELHNRLVALTRVFHCMPGLLNSIRTHTV